MAVCRYTMPRGELFTTCNSHMALSVSSDSVQSIENTLLHFPFFFFVRCILVTAPGIQDVPINLFLTSQLPNRLIAPIFASQCQRTLNMPRSLRASSTRTGGKSTNNTGHAGALQSVSQCCLWCYPQSFLVLVFLVPAHQIATYGQFQQLTKYFLSSPFASQLSGALA